MRSDLAGAAIMLAAIFITSAGGGSRAWGQRVALQGTISREASAKATPLGPVDPDQPVQLAFVLPLRNQAVLTDMLNHLYTPGDPLYGKFLTPEQFAAQYGPTQNDVNAIAQFALANGLTVSKVHPNRTIIDVQGPAAAVQNAFQVKLNRFVAPDGHPFHQADREAQAPPEIGQRLLTVLGLDTAAHGHPRDLRRSPAGFRAQGAGPAGGLTPQQVREAYSMNAANFPTGAGETLGLFEESSYNPSDVATFEKQFGLPNVPLQNIPVDGFSFSQPLDDGSSEVDLDIEMQVALAPGAKRILVYGGSGNDATNVIDEYNQIAVDDAANEISTSWGYSYDDLTVGQRNAENNIFQQMAAQGQSMFTASGDDNAYGDYPLTNGADTSVAVEDPESQPFIVAVGGTALTTNAAGAYVSETTWNDGHRIGDGGSEGGISSIWPIPSYQVGAITAASFGSTTMRNVPDVALNAEPNTGYAIYVASDGGWEVIGGTSTASPLWSAYMAAVNQRRLSAGAARIGFPNPMLYSIGKGARYSKDFHDIADRSSNIVYFAVAGYDLCTGWGSPVGDQLMNDLAPAATIPAGELMLSLPYSYSGLSADAANLLGLSVSSSGAANLVTYNPLSNTYLSYPNLPGGAGKQTVPGRGYWVLEPASLPFEGTGNLVASPYSLSINGGWNMIGDPFTTALPLSQVQIKVGNNAAVSIPTAQNTGVVSGPVYGYNPAINNYVQATTLQPFSGYWIYVPPPAAGSTITLTFINAGS